MVSWSDDTQAAWELYAHELAQLPGVVAISTGRRIRDGKETREQTVVVTVRRKLPLSQLPSSAIVPRELPLPDGTIVGTDVVEDPSSVYSPDQDRASYRPVPGGCEIGPVGSTFLGTLGGWFCAPNPHGRGWDTVWLTNAHVADPWTFSAVPADARMRQPQGGGVIGNSTAVNGWPQPLPATGTTLNGVTDAAIGVLDPAVDPDFQVLQIAPAPFEIDAVTAGLAVQKRGRTTRLRTGTVQTQPGGTPFLAATVNSPAGGQVWFGLPGQPRMFRIVSPGTGIGNAFGMPGDSGSLVFANNAGQIASTFPCVGLYFAGNGAWVASQPNPNAWTVTGLAFDIGNVMAQMNLETVCTCVVRSILDAIFGRRSVDSSDSMSAREAVVRSESMMRRFRAKVLENSSVGKTIAAAIAETVPDIARVLASDPTAYGLAVDLLEPWASEATSLGVLARTLDEATVSTAVALAERVMRMAPDTGETIEPLINLMKDNEGESIRKLIGTYRPGRPPKPEKGDETGKQRGTK